MSVAVQRTVESRELRTDPGHTPVVRRLVGGFYLVMGGVNAGIVAADPQTYRTFADGSFWPFVTSTWREVVMAHPAVWLLLLAAGEVVLGALLLRGGAPARAGWVGVVAFHVLLLPFGFGIWLWSLPVLAILLPVVRRDWSLLTDAASPGPGVPARRAAPGEHIVIDVAAEGTAGTFWFAAVLGALVVSASLYGLLAEAPYRSLPDATVLGARAQDACSIVVAALLLALAARARASAGTVLVRSGLLAYLLYSYLIYVTGVPMNRMFLVYVAIVMLSGAGLVAGLLRVLAATPRSTPSRRLRVGTGWLLVVTAVLFAALWLSMLLPFAWGGDRPETEGAGGTPYPVFVLDLAIVLPCIAAVGVLLLRGRPMGPPLAVVALIKIVTLFAALWAGPLVALATHDAVHLGPDAVPSLVLLLASTVLAVRWLRSFPSEPPAWEGSSHENARRA